MDCSSDEMNQKLAEEAYAAMKHAYAPYSHFRVGAALLTKEAEKFLRAVILKMLRTVQPTVRSVRQLLKRYRKRYTQIERIAIVSSSHQKTPPCGICRQVLAEFMTENAQILLADKDGIESYTIKDLLPESFKL